MANQELIHSNVIQLPFGQSFSFPFAPSGGSVEVIVETSLLPTPVPAPFIPITGIITPGMEKPRILKEISQEGLDITDDIEDFDNLKGVGTIGTPTNPSLPTIPIPPPPLNPQELNVQIFNSEGVPQTAIGKTPLILPQVEFRGNEESEVPRNIHPTWSVLVTNLTQTNTNAAVTVYVQFIGWPPSPELTF